ncbi:MAG: tetratricopeptide repeat protein [Pirellulaceae bacterium]
MRAQSIDEKAIFKVACCIASTEARNDYLNQVCGGDHQEVRDRVAFLLRMQEESPSFMESPIAGGDATLDMGPALEIPGTQIGPYKLLEQIGEGGMGVVYMASQKQPVRRTVALKIIKPGMDTREVVQRFEAERQALALMNHPNIARVFDGGATEAGRPYFVMELVKGKPITQYCDRQQLATRERLALFVTLCHGAQHAHQKGVIHRDLKPSNILIEVHDVRPVPKIIDFGVAKAIGPQLTEKTLHTGFDQMVGTPLYMSPEQAGQSSVDVDTRSDVYSLGVLLYELLTGHTPFERDTLRAAGVDEMRRIIREVEPPRPSARVSTLEAADLSTVAERHQIEPRKLSQELRGELDWIVMKALEKDRDRRYATANDLAADVQRYLDDEPVQACPPSTIYRLRKLVRHHRTALVGAAGLLLGVVFLLVGTTLVALNQGAVAQGRLHVQQRINEALAEVARLRGSASESKADDEARWVAAREQLQLAVGLATSGPLDADLLAQVRTLERQLDQEQSARAQEQRDRVLLATLEQAWRLQANVDVGESRFAKEDSVPILRQALRDYGITILDSSPDRVAATIASRPEQVRQHLLEAMEELRALARPMIGIAMRTTNGMTVITDIAPDSPAARDGRLHEGDQLVGVGEGRDGEIASTRSLALPAVMELSRGESGTIVRLEVVPKGETEPRVYEIQRDPTAAWLKAVLKVADRDPWRCQLREARNEEDQAKRRVALEDLAEQADVQGQPPRVLTRLADQLVVLGARDRATTLLKRVQKAYPGDLWANANLACVLKDSRPPRWEEAIRYYTAAIALRPDSAGLHVNLGVALVEQGRLEEANAEYRESLRIAPSYAAPRCNLVTNLIKLGEEEEAEAVAREAVRLWPQTPGFHCNLAGALDRLGKRQEAAAAYREALRLDPGLVGAHEQMAFDLYREGKHEESLEKFREVIRMDPTSATWHYNYGVTLGLMGREDEASEVYRTCLKLDPSCVPALTNLIGYLVDQGRAEEAVAVCREVLERAPNSPDVQATWNTLAKCLNACGRKEEAIAAYRESSRLLPQAFLPYANLARRLADPLDPTLQQPQEAIELALKAVELEPQEELAWSALGYARFCNQEWQASIEAFQKSESLIDVRKYGVLYTFDERSWWDNHIYRAMAYWHLGQTAEARAWFLVGEYRLKGNGPNGDSKCLQEAAKLLGISLDEPTPTQETIAAYRATLQTNPEGAMRHNELAWLLATTPDLPYRDAELAVHYALQAVQLLPQEANVWNTLGVAHYRNRQWGESIEALQKSLDRSVGGAVCDWLFLAMAHWQLDQKAEARKWYDKSVTWMKEHAENGSDEQITRFRAEAEQLLGAEKSENEQPNSSECAVPPDKAASLDTPPPDSPAIPPKQP